jgi:hypothetical protein
MNDDEQAPTPGPQKSAHAVPSPLPNSHNSPSNVPAHAQLVPPVQIILVPPNVPANVQKVIDAIFGSGKI